MDLDMKVNRKQATFLKRSIENWNHAGLLDENVATKLNQNIQIQNYDWKNLAKYSFWTSIVCLIISIVTLFADKAFMAFLEILFNAPEIVKFLTFSLLSAFMYWLGIKRRRLQPLKLFSNEAILFFGVFSTGAAIYQLKLIFNLNIDQYSILFLLASFVYGVHGYQLKSKLVWLFSLISIGSWMGSSEWASKFLEMSYFLRFVLLGIVITSLALMVEKKQSLEYFFRTSLVMGLFYMFTGLWLLSIFGFNMETISSDHLNQFGVYYFAMLLGIVAIGAIYHGVRFDNVVSKGFGITFLIINLYTRFFDFFFGRVHDSIFFALLGISFWYVGSRAEKIWNFGESRKTTIAN